MAYDPELADRIRDVLAAESPVVEKRMFGGLAFLVGGYMTVCAGSRGALMLRVDPEQLDELLAAPRARPFEMRGRPMAGWINVDIDASVSDAELARWVERGLDYVRTLPPRT